MMPLLVLPAMIGVLVDTADMSESFAGWSASIKLLGGAAIGLLLAIRIHHLNLRKVCAIALALAVVCDLASAFFAGPTTIFLIARGVTGVAMGAAYISAIASFARFDDYERGFGLFVTLQFILSGFGLYLVPVYSQELGASGLFLVFAMLDLMALALTRFLPNEIAANRQSETPPPELRVLLTVSTVLAILGFALFEAANNAQFTYIERFGVALDLSEHQIGIALLVASLIGIPGAFTIVVVGHRFGTIGPLMFGIAIAIAGLTILINASNYQWFFVGGCFMGFSWAYCLPYIQSLLASLDRDGSAIAAGASIAILGSALGPGAAAVVVTGGNYIRVFMMAILLFVVAIVSFLIASRHRNQEPSGQS